MSKLSITVREGESVRLAVPPSDVATEIEVFVVGSNRGRSSLRFEAPREVVIQRSDCRSDLRQPE